MSIRDALAVEMTQARLQGLQDRVRALRMLMAELQVAETSGKDFKEVDVVKSYAKKLRKTVEEYERLGLDERAAGVRAELDAVMAFLPAQMDRSQLEDLITALVEEKGYGPRDIGQVMRAIMSEYGDVVDGRLVQEVAAEKLGERK